MKRQLLYATVLICCFIVIVFFPIFFSNKAFFFGDNYTLMVPGKIFAAQTIKQQGVIPFWQPYILSGTPFFADLNQSLFHPSTLLFLLFSPSVAVNLTILIHLFIGSLGVFLLLRQKTTSFILAIGCSFLWVIAEPTIGWSNNFTFLQSGAWTPWLLYIAINSSIPAGWFIPLITLSILGGHPQPLVYTLAVVALYFVYRRKWQRLFSFIGAGCISILLLLPVLVPFAEFSILSTRNAASISEKVVGSIHPLHLIHWLIPTFFSNPAIGIAWGPDWDHIKTVCGYTSIAGLFGICLSLCRFKKLAHNDKFFVFVAILGVGFALLGNFPFLAFLVYHIPLINSFRNPSASVFLYVLAALFLIPNFFTLLEKLRRKKMIIYLFSVWAFLLGSFIIWHYFSFSIWSYINLISHHLLERSQIHTYARDVLIVSNILYQSCLSLGLFILVVLLFPRFRVITIFIIVLDVYLAHSSLLFFAPKTVYSPQIDNERLSVLTTNGLYRSLSLSGYLPYVGIDDYWKGMYIKPPFGESVYSSNETQSLHRLLARQANLGVNWNQVSAIPSIDGYATMLLRQTSDFWKNPSSPQTRINYVDRVNPIDARLSDQSVRYFAFDKTAVAAGEIPSEYRQFPVKIESKDWAILENASALPIVRYSSFPQEEIAFLPGNVNQLNFQADNATESSILIKVSPYPGWKCMMDEKPCIIESDGLGMKLYAPAGKHVYRLQFTPIGIPVTLWISGGTIAGYLLYLWLCKKQKLKHINAVQ